MSLTLQLLKNHEVRRYEAGETVLRHGGKSGVLLVLIEGAFEVKKGEFIIDTISEPGAIFGEVSVLANVGHSADVIASKPSKAYVIEEPRTYLRVNPDFHILVSELLARRLNHMVAYLANVKRQYEGHDHLGMVDEVLESLTHAQAVAAAAKRPGIVREDPID